MVDQKPINVNEKTQISINLGFLITGIVGVISLVIIFITMRSDVLTMLARINTQETIISSQQVEITAFKIHMQSIDDKLEYLKQIIEIDQSSHRNVDK